MTPGRSSCLPPMRTEDDHTIGSFENALSQPIPQPHPLYPCLRRPHSAVCQTYAPPLPTDRTGL